MALFIDNTTFQIVFRQHEYNTEVLDNKIQPVSKDAGCLVLQLTPNNKWSYDVKVICDSKLSMAWHEYERLSGGKQIKSNIPTLHYVIILKDKFKEYLEVNNYSFNPKVETKIEDKKNKGSVITPLEYKLSRASEEYTYRYKSPNEK